MKKYQYLLGLCIAALLMPVLSSCEDDSLFFRTGNMSKLAFVVGTADDEAPKASTRGVVHVVDYFVDEEGDTLYLACRISDMDQPAVTDSAVTRATPISASSTDNTLASVYGQFNVSAYKDGKVSRPLKETDEDGNELTNAKSYVNVTFSARMTTGGTQQTDGTNPVWELTSGGSDNFCWPKNGSLTFYTFAPTTTVKSGPSWTGLTPADNYKDDGVIEFDYTVPSNKTNSDSKRVDAEEQPDILVSSVNVKRSDVNEYEESTDTKYVVVPLTLYHALCAVEFKVNASIAPEDLLKKDVTVTSVSLGNLKGSGTCTFNPSATTGSGSARYISWDFTDVTDNTGNYSQTYNFENDYPADEDLKASIGTAAQTFMLIPQTVGVKTATTDPVSDSPNASITLGYLTPNNKAKTKSVSLHKNKSYTWKAGKKYTYYLTGDLTSLTLDGSVLSWDTDDDTEMPIRHYVLTASKNEFTYDKLDAEQSHTFDVQSYYYTGDTDDGTTRKAVNCKVEYEDASGNWQVLGSTAFVSSYASSAPYLGSVGTTDVNSLSALSASTLDDDLKSDDGMTFVLSANRYASRSTLMYEKSLSELVFSGDATKAKNWDLSKCSIGGEYNASNAQNTANCYIVKHPGTYNFPLVYGNAIKNGAANTKAYSTNSTALPGVDGYYPLYSFVNFAGNPVQEIMKYKANGATDGTENNTNPGYILSNIKNMMMMTIGYTADPNGIMNADNFKKEKIAAYVEGNNKQGIPASFTYLKAKLLWQDEPGMISDVKLVAGSKNGYVTDSYISFKTADGSALKQCNALIALYVDADKDDVIDASEPIVWSWHIWVTNADLSTTTQVTGSSVANTNGLHISYGGNYNFMSRDLGECDMVDAVLKTLKPSYAWMDGMNLRISQTEGDAQPQIITIHQPGMEIHPKPYAPLYQWGRKDPFGGYNLSTSASRVLYNEGGTAITVPTTNIGSDNHYVSDATRLGGIGETIKKPLEMRKISIENVSSSSFTLYFNLWNNNINTGLDFGDTGNTISFTYLGSPIKTIYDPCPYGFLVPDERAYLAFDPNNGWQVRSSAVFFDTNQTSVALAQTSIPDGAVTLLDANGAENVNMVFPFFKTKQLNGSYYADGGAKRLTSSLSNRMANIFLSIDNPNSMDTNALFYTTVMFNARAVRPIRE